MVTDIAKLREDVLITGEDVAGIVTRAFEHARTGDLNNIPLISSRLRSQRWVQSLAAELRLFYKADNDVRVLCRTDDSHKKELRINELLYDVLVCRVATTQTPRKHTATYVSKALWQIESEFARDTIQALKDFSKLVLGSAPYKLFVAPYVGKRESQSYLTALTLPALACDGEVFLAQLPHPARWDDGDAPRVFILREGQWYPVDGEDPVVQ